jgi:rod shape-determining protein MreC
LKQRQGTVLHEAAPIKNLIQRFAYLFLVLAAFAVMLVGKADTLLLEKVRANVTDAVAPILTILSRPAATVSNIVDKGQEIISLREENARLREENARLLQWQAVARRLNVENRELRDINRFNPAGAIKFVSARVIADTGGTFAHSLVLSAGKRQGVRKGQAVITGDGLVGRIAGVGRNSSRVLLITDLNSRIPVVIESSRARAILAGDNVDRPKLIHLPPGASISPGDRIVTSGHGGALPWGLPVGTVASVSDEGIAVQPFVERGRLEYVRAVDFGLDGIVKTLPDTATKSGKASDSGKSKGK